MNRSRAILFVLFVSTIFLPRGAFAMSTDYSQYTPGQTIQVTCNDPTDSVEVYDITDGTDNVLSIGYGGVTQGNFPCDPGSITFDSLIGHTYALLEVTQTNTCTDQTYLGCKNAYFFVGEADLIIGDTSVASNGGSTLSYGLNKSTYAPGETIFFNCHLPNRSLELYDITDGTDNVLSIGYGGSTQGNFPCSSGAFTFNGEDGHYYALLELTQSNTCTDQTYLGCKSQDFFKGEYDFSVVEPAGRAPITFPTAIITAPKAGDAFSYSGTIKYTTLNANQVNLYYSTTLADWDTSLLADQKDKIQIANDIPTSGSYIWDTTKLLAGSLYRILVDVVGPNGTLGEAISDLFSIDFTPPTFVVKSNPPVTRGSDVTVSVDASENLKAAPTVTVTQLGATPATLKMTGQGSHYEGVYSILKGHDGIATIAVSGSDVAGNVGTTTLSGGTFAVGVSPPPAPKVASPQNNQVVATSTISVSGTLRADTVAVLTVNGADTYYATSTPDGKFTIPNVRLSKTLNRGLNALSVLARDQAGLTSAATLAEVKYNIAPTLSVSAPAREATVSATTPLTVQSKDENADPLLFTYQIIPAGSFDATVAATSSVNSWDTIGDELSSGNFSWDSTEAEDGQYFLRVIADDGFAKSYSTSTPFTIRNTSPFFRFEDGRKTVTNKTSVTITGRALAPTSIFPRPNVTTVEYSLDKGKTWKKVSLSSGENTPEARFSLTLTKLTEGTQGLLWRVKDNRGLYGRASHPVVVDLTAPKAPIVNSPVNNAFITAESDEDTSRDGLQVTVSGSAEPQSTVTLDTGSTTLTTKALTDGTYAFRAVDVPRRGVNPFTLTATDAAGNVSPVARVNVVYDNPPTLAILSPKPFRGLTGEGKISWSVSDPDNDPVQGLALEYRRGSGAYKAISIDQGKNTATLDVSDFPEASDYQLRLTAGDGMATSSDTISFSVDRTPPTLSSLTLDTTVLGKGSVLRAHGTAHDDLSGIEYVEYAITEGEPSSFYTALLTKGFLQDDASFSIQYPTKLSDGTFTVYARAVDAAGNTSPVVSRTVTVDTSPPHIGSFDVLAEGVRVAPSEEGAIHLYKGMRALFEVSLEGDTDSASVIAGGNTVPLKKDLASGLWQATLDAGTTGTTTLSLTAVDAVGNSLAATPIGSFATLPQGAVTDESAQSISGAAIKVLVLDEGTGNYAPFSSNVITTATDGSYSLALPQGNYELVVSKSGYRSATEKVTLDRAGFVNTAFALEKYSGVWGYVQSVYDYFFSP